MPWFYCDECGDSIKKPKLATHFRQCRGFTFTCIDCSATFDRNTVNGHSTCVTEHEKYALGATKPGGFAANGFSAPTQPSTKPAGEAEPSGLEFLSTRPPWKCSVCNVSCTSQDTLMSHAAGVKHKRRARAATAAANGGPAAAENGSTPPPAVGSGPDQPGTPDKDQQAQPQPQQQQASTGTKRAAPAEPSSSWSSSSSESEGEETSKQAAKKQKGSKGQAVHPALQDADKVAKLVKLVKKKLEAKGKVGQKKLQRISAKKLKLEDAEAVTEELLKAIYSKLQAEGVGKLQGKKLIAA